MVECLSPDFSGKQDGVSQARIIQILMTEWISPAKYEDF
jgi:hypothetical protein